MTVGKVQPLEGQIILRTVAGREYWDSPGFAEIETADRFNPSARFGFHFCPGPYIMISFSSALLSTGHH